MKKPLIIKPSSLNRVKSIDFQTFSKGGVTEAVSKKEKAKKYLQNHESDSDVTPTQLSKFNLSPQIVRNKITSKSTYLDKRNYVTAYSFYVSPLAFFDVHFIIAAACIIVVAITEKRLAKYGIIGGAAALSALLRILLPIVAFGSIIYLISRLGIFI